MKILSLITIGITCLSSALSAQSFVPKKKLSDPIPREVEVLYTKGLKFLASKQKANGSWDGSYYSSYPGTVGLALLSFLAHGDDPNHGPYAKNIKASLNYLLDQQQRNGFIGKNTSFANMYSHGFATLALAEAYGMVEDDRIGSALKKAVNLILVSQKNNRLGAWRYGPLDDDADSTVAGCQIVALYAARNAGIPVPDTALKKAHKYMDSCRNKQTGSYGYTRPSNGRPTLTAIGLLSEALAKNNDTPEFKKSLAYLKTKLKHRETTYIYYWEYYMAQALFQADEETWKQWNKLNIAYLKALQQPNGSFTGTKGTTFSTAGALLSLALNYRFLPIYEK